MSFEDSMHIAASDAACILDQANACLRCNETWEAQAGAELECACAAGQEVCVGCQMVRQQLGSRPHDLSCEIIVRCRSRFPAQPCTQFPRACTQVAPVLMLPGNRGV